MKHIGLWALLTLQCVVAASSFDVSPSARRLLTSFKNPYRFPQSKDRFLEHVPQDKNRQTWQRSLKQAEEEVCSWIADDEVCVFHPLAAEHFLKATDNVVADFVKREIECAAIDDGDSCADSGCKWHDGFCYREHEAYRKFHSADCMKDINDLVNVRAGELECSRKTTEYECRAADRCSWFEENCDFDRWLYYYGLRSNGSFPEGSEELFGNRTVQLTNGAAIAIENGEITAWSDLLDWNPPPLDCPPSQQQLVCDYIEALSSSIIHTLYCSFEYDTDFKLPDCDNDEYCTANLDSLEPVCQVSFDKLRPAFSKAQKVFAEAIEDPEARKFEMKTAECLAFSNADDCDGHDGCLWRDTGAICIVSQKWIDHEIYDIVGKDKDPVCQYFTLSVRYGCADIEDKDECKANLRCFYNEDIEFCNIGTDGETEFALSLADAEDAFLGTVEACKDARTEKACADVTASPDESGGPEESVVSPEAQDANDAEASFSAESPESEDDDEVIDVVDYDVTDDTDTTVKSMEPLKPSPESKNKTKIDPSPSPTKNGPVEAADDSDDDPDMLRARDFSFGDFFTGGGR